MAAAKKDEGVKAVKVDRVLVPIAYATAVNGEVVQLVKGDDVTTDRFTQKSVDHLRSIGFVGSSD